MYTFGLLFKTFENEKMAAGPVAQIRLEHGRTANYEKDKGPYVSSECLSLIDLKNEVARLKAELDEILEKGRQQFNLDVA
jgi:hypothetical protein